MLRSVKLPIVCKSLHFGDLERSDMVFQWGFPLLVGPSWLADSDITIALIAVLIFAIAGLVTLIVAAHDNHDPSKAIAGFELLLVALVVWVFGATPWMLLISIIVSAAMACAVTYFALYWVLWHGIILNGYHAIRYIVHKE